MKTSERDLAAHDGATLHLWIWEPESDRPRGVVQIVHGMAEHAGRYAHVAESLAGAGYATYALDLRGHGKTAASADDLGIFAEQAGWERVLEDIGLVQDRILERYPGVARCLLGHSLGSFLAQTYVLRRPASLDALVLTGTNVGGGLLVEAGRVLSRLERRRSGARGRSALLELLSFGTYNRGFRPSRTEADWISSDPRQVDLYIRDPRCGFRSTNQIWVELTDALSELGRTRWPNVPRDLPIYVFSGALDPVGLRTKGVRRLLRRLERSGFRDVSHRFYPDARHECLNEVNREQVERDLIEWLDRKLSPRTRPG